MKLEVTEIFEKNMRAWVDGKRRAFNEGGTSSSKTWSILQGLVLIAQNAESEFLISVVSESFPHLKRGCIRDFKMILGESFNPACWNMSDHIYSFGKGKIEFFPADDPSKMRGGRRKVLFINEANNVVYDSFRELDTRTELFTFLDWNPVSEFWAHENRLFDQPENVYIHSTYLDAIQLLPKEVVATIEAYRDTDPNWWNIYGLGLIGKVEGLVYPKFKQVDALPSGEVFYGMDLGYSNDPTVVVRNVIDGNKLFSEEILYEAGLTNDMIAHRLDELGVLRHDDQIYCDSAEPKSIEEIYRYGFNIYPAPKGKDSVEYGHQLVRQMEQYWTKSSLNCIKEQRNFRYLQDKAGKYTEKTTHNWSHGMSARRYAVVARGVKPKVQVHARSYLKKGRGA